MRIGTWNVEYAAGAAKNAARLLRLRDARADLWVLTETHDDLDLGPTHTAVRSEQRPTGRAGARWVTIWSAFPVVRSVATRDPVRTTAAIVDAPRCPLLVYGTVMPWHTDPGPTGGARNWVEHHRVVPEQAREWLELRDAHPGIAMCVAGDFNMDLGGRHYYGTTAGRAALVEGLRAVELVCLTSTDRVPAGRLSHAPIDHVCVSAGIAEDASVVEAWDGSVEGVRLSDHSGLVVACP